MNEGNKGAEKNQRKISGLNSLPCRVKLLSTMDFTFTNGLLRRSIAAEAVAALFFTIQRPYLFPIDYSLRFFFIYNRIFQLFLTDMLVDSLSLLPHSYISCQAIFQATNWHEHVPSRSGRTPSSLLFYQFIFSCREHGILLKHNLQGCQPDSFCDLRMSRFFHIL